MASQDLEDFGRRLEAVFSHARPAASDVESEPASHRDRAGPEPGPGPGTTPPPPSYGSIFPAPRPVLVPPLPGTPPPSGPSARPSLTFTTSLAAALLLIFVAQIVTIIVCDKGIRHLTHANTTTTSLARRGLAIVLAATATEMACTWFLSPAMYRLARGGPFGVLYGLMAAEALATTAYLFHCVALDRRRGLCDGLSGAAAANCGQGLSSAVGVGCVRVITTSPCYLAVLARDALARLPLRPPPPPPHRDHQIALDTRDERPRHVS